MIVVDKLNNYINYRNRQGINLQKKMISVNL